MKSSHPPEGNMGFIFVDVICETVSSGGWCALNGFKATTLFG